MQAELKMVDFWIRQYHNGNLFAEIDDLLVLYATIEPRWSHSYIVLGAGSTRTIFDDTLPERYAIKRADVYYKLMKKIYIVRGIKKAAKTLPHGRPQRLYELKYVHGHRTNTVRKLMGMKEATYFRLQDKVLKHFYKQIGLYI